VVLFLAYALVVLLLESPLLSTSLPGAAGASAAASLKLHLDGAWEGVRAAPARPSKHPHRETLSVDGGRRLSGIVFFKCM
jgi:hypothetical protein